MKCLKKNFERNKQLNIFVFVVAVIILIELFKNSCKMFSTFVKKNEFNRPFKFLNCIIIMNHAKLNNPLGSSINYVTLLCRER